MPPPSKRCQPIRAGSVLAAHSRVGGREHVVEAFGVFAVMRSSAAPFVAAEKRTHAHANAWEGVMRLLGGMGRGRRTSCGRTCDRIQRRTSWCTPGGGNFPRSCRQHLPFHVMGVLQPHRNNYLVFLEDSIRNSRRHLLCKCRNDHRSSSSRSPHHLHRRLKPLPHPHRSSFHCGSSNCDYQAQRRRN